MSLDHFGEANLGKYKGILTPMARSEKVNRTIQKSLCFIGVVTIFISGCETVQQAGNSALKSAGSAATTANLSCGRIAGTCYESYVSTQPMIIVNEKLPYTSHYYTCYANDRRIGSGSEKIIFQSTTQGWSQQHNILMPKNELWKAKMIRSAPNPIYPNHGLYLVQRGDEKSGYGYAFVEATNTSLKFYRPDPLRRSSNIAHESYADIKTRYQNKLQLKIELMEDGRSRVEGSPIGVAAFVQNEEVRELMSPVMTCTVMAQDKN